MLNYLEANAAYNRTIRLMLLIATALFAGGCPPYESPIGPVVPQQEGTQYIYIHTQLDADSIPLATYNDTLTVLSHCASAHGRECTTELQGGTDTATGTAPRYYLAVGETNSPELYDTHIGNWFILPIYIYTPAEYADTLHTTTPGGAPLRTDFVSMVEPLSQLESTAYVGETYYNVARFRITTTERTTRLDGTETQPNQITTVATYTIAPELGYFTRHEHLRTGTDWQGRPIYQHYVRDLAAVE